MLTQKEEERFNELLDINDLSLEEDIEYTVLWNKKHEKETFIKDDTQNLTKLGSKETKYVYDNPSPELLETFQNQYPNREYTTEFVFNEFSSLCLSGDTMIDVSRNEIEFPNGIAIKNLVGTEGYVFSFDKKQNKPVAKKYHSVRKTKSNTDVIKINLEHLHCDGKGTMEWIPKELIVTPDHPILVCVGWAKYKWIRAKCLKPGMRLVANQKDNDHIRGKARHRLLMEELVGRHLMKDEHVHHIDENHYNNCIKNLEVKLQSKHLSDHKKELYGYDWLPIKEMVQLYNNGSENFNTLAKKYNCDVSTIVARIENLVEKRTQRESLLAKPESKKLHELMKECCFFYEKGYTIYELSDFYKVHSTTILDWIKKEEGGIRTSLETKKLRKNVVLEGLNHKVISIESAGKMDVYNMEVEDTECFFANGVVVHNCPKTGQPDFATIKIEYIANEKCIETKSLKLYLLSYRMYGTFMETLTNRILDDLIAVCQPKYMVVISNFNARGGTLINVMARYGEPGYGEK